MEEETNSHLPQEHWRESEAQTPYSLFERGSLCRNPSSLLLRCGTRPYEWGTQWDSNLIMKVCESSWLTITPPQGDHFLLRHVNTCWLLCAAVSLTIMVSKWIQNKNVISFIFRLIPVGKVWTPLSALVWVKYYHWCFSTEMALALNNLRMLICS